MKRPLILLKLIGVLMGFYLICRLLFFIFCYRYFKDNGLGETLLSFVYGLRFDLSAIFALNALFIFFFLLPVPFKETRVYRIVLAFIFLAPNFIGLAANCADIGYFPFTNKRTTFDVFEVMSRDLQGGKLFSVFLVDFWYVFLIWSLLCAGLWFLFRKIYKAQKEENGFTLRLFMKELAVFILGGTLTFIGFRGGFQLMPIYNATAAECASAKNVPLVLNSAFSIIKTADQPELKQFHFFSDEEAEKIVPTKICFKDKTFQKRNVVVLILESFSKEYIGYFNKGVGYTPFLDSLIKQSLIFERAFSNGKTSAQGIPSVVAGIPSLNDEPYLTSAYGSNNINSIASLLKEEGYSTAFYHGGNNGTMGFQAFSGFSGYEKYYGRNEYNNESDFDGHWGIWDEPYLQYFSGNLSKTKEPFCATLFTLSSHHPFEVPSRYKEKFKEGPAPITKSVSYTDYALQRFFETAKKTSWYNNTLFVLVADHTGPPIANYYYKGIGNFAIPIIFFDPGKQLKGQNFKLTQQIDILPGVMDYLGYSKPFFSFGQSPFDTLSNGYCINYQNGTYEMIAEKDAIDFNGEKTTAHYYWINDSILEKNLINSHLPASVDLDKKTKAFLQNYSRSLIGNKMHIR